MQVFRVEVAHRETGATDVLYVEAETSAEAEKIANDRGWLVSAVAEAPPVARPSPQPLPIPINVRSESPRSYGGASRQSIVGAIVFGIGLLMLGVNQANWMSMPSNHSSDLQGFRFKSDNAVGATANSLEKLEQSVPREVTLLRYDIGDVKALLVAGLGLLVVAVSKK